MNPPLEIKVPWRQAKPGGPIPEPIRSTLVRSHILTNLCEPKIVEKLKVRGEITFL
ncbi:MAG: hypothetical protein ACI9R3_002091 [Verrucomicrobiales bacterium]|jgi:hypothetical protein